MTKIRKISEHAPVFPCELSCKDGSWVTWSGNGLLELLQAADTPHALHIYWRPLKDGPMPTEAPQSALLPAETGLPHTTFDGNSLYVRLRAGDIAKTSVLKEWPHVALDLDANGNVLGMEAIFSATPPAPSALAPGPVKDSPRWTYSHYRATLKRDGKAFAIVSPNGRDSLNDNHAQELLALLNAPASEAELLLAEFSLAFHDWYISPEPQEHTDRLFEADVKARAHFAKPETKA